MNYIQHTPVNKLYEELVKNLDFNSPVLSDMSGWKTIERPDIITRTSDKFLTSAIFITETPPPFLKLCLNYSVSIITSISIVILANLSSQNGIIIDCVRGVL
jgi:hypothetical protein